MPAAARFLSTIVVYGFAVPLDRARTALGLRPLIAGMMNRFRGRRDWADVFAGYSPTGHDIFVSTFAKSGTNWMMQIAHQIAFRGAGEYRNIHDVIPWPDMDGGRRRMSIDLENPVVQRLSPTGLRVIKTHLKAEHVPFSRNAKYLVVIRDPKEVFVSSYYFIRGVAGPLMPTPEVWLELFLDNCFPLNFDSNWAEHTAGYWALRHEPNVLILPFREMKRDLAGTVQQVARLLDVELAAGDLERIVELGSFAHMKSINHKFSPMDPGSLPWAEGFTMMRQGRSGNAGEMLTVEQQGRIDEYCEAELGRLGSDFPYREYFNVTTAGNEALATA
jgi:aryl sulfotransferase